MDIADIRPPTDPRTGAARLARAAAAGVALAWLAPCASAAILYKSIGPNGVVQFSDVPPEHGVIVEERFVPEPPGIGAAAADEGQDPLEALENPLQSLADDGASDPALAHANAQVDLAEHALALARGSKAARREGLRLQVAARDPSQEARVRFYERDLAAARANLLEALKRHSR